MYAEKYGWTFRETEGHYVSDLRALEILEFEESRLNKNKGDGGSVDLTRKLPRSIKRGLKHGRG